MTRRSLRVFLALFLLSFLGQAKSVTDVFGRPLAAVIAQGRPTLVLYANKATKDSVQRPAQALALRLKDEPFVTVVRFDVRDVPGLFHGVARDRIKDSQRDGVRSYVEMFRRHGLQPPADAKERLVFVMDEDGRAHSAVGLPKGFKEAYALVLDGEGHEIARGPFPRDEAMLEDALRRAARPPPAE